MRNVLIRRVYLIFREMGSIQMHIVSRFLPEMCWCAWAVLTWCIRQETLKNRKGLPCNSTALKAKIKTGLDELMPSAFGMSSVPLAEFLSSLVISAFRGLQKHHLRARTLSMPLFLRVSVWGGDEISLLCKA